MLPLATIAVVSKTAIVGSESIIDQHKREGGEREEEKEKEEGKTGKLDEFDGFKCIVLVVITV